jgi:hypothetical protein
MSGPFDTFENIAIWAALDCRSHLKAGEIFGKLNLNHALELPFFHISSIDWTSVNWIDTTVGLCVTLLQEPLLASLIHPLASFCLKM